jgi:hypothetical protein
VRQQTADEEHFARARDRRIGCERVVIDAAENHTRGREIMLPKRDPAELAAVKMTGVPARHVDEMMQRNAAAAKIRRVDRCSGRSRVQQREARHHRIRLVIVNDIGVTELRDHRRIDRIDGEASMRNPVADHVDLEIAEALLARFHPERQQARRHARCHRARELQRIALASANQPFWAEERRHDVRDARTSSIHEIHPFVSSIILDTGRFAGDNKYFSHQ